MTDFRSYMSSEYFAENQMVADLDTALKQISDTFVKTYYHKTKPWPYDVRPGPSLPSGESPKARMRWSCVPPWQ
jgi:hypothetical protein